jgi:hypothetical protein
MKSILLGCLLGLIVASEANACIPFFREFEGQTVDVPMAAKVGKDCDIYFGSSGPTEGIRIDKKPARGTVSVANGSRLSYRPRAGAGGSDTFTFTRYGKTVGNRPTTRSVRVLVTIE